MLWRCVDRGHPEYQAQLHPLGNSLGPFLGRSSPWLGILPSLLLYLAQPLPHSQYPSGLRTKKKKQIKTTIMCSSISVAVFNHVAMQSDLSFFLLQFPYLYHWEDNGTY